jgi:tartrate dehydratase alpha subunit/fumarate hydratase class I-like protein
MSEWTTGTAMELWDRLWKEYKERISDTFIERDKAIVEFKQQTDAKFASRNEIQQTMKDAAESAALEMQKLAATFITRKEAMSMVLAACTITGTVVMVIEFFTRK